MLNQWILALTTAGADKDAVVVNGGSRSDGKDQGNRDVVKSQTRLTVRIKMGKVETRDMVEES